MTINSKSEAEYQKQVLENKIAGLEAELKLIDQYRAAYRQQLKNEGYSDFEARTARQYDEGGINTPGQRKRVCEHSLARAKAELEEVEQALAKFAEQSIYRRPKPLAHGCLNMRKKIYPDGPNKITGDWLEMPGIGPYSLLIDNQICSVINGILCVDDPESPYDGMAVADYTGRIVPAYQKELERRKKEVREKAMTHRAEVLVLKGQGREKEIENLEAPSEPMLKTGQLPPWPEGVRNFKQNSKN